MNKRIEFLIAVLFFATWIQAQCVSGGTIFTTFASTINISQPPSFVANLNYEICNPGFVTDTSGGVAYRVYYIGGGRLDFKAFKSSYIYMKTGATLNVLGGANMITIVHEPGVTITGAISSSVVACSPIAFPSPNSCGAVGINEPETRQQFELFPNPFEARLKITITGINETIKVFNSLGSLVYTGTIENGTAEIDLSCEKQGLYFIQVGRVIKKVFKL